MRASIAIVCHDASKSLCPSNRLDMPALPLHGISFRNGVRFSVQTTSCGRAPCNRCRGRTGVLPSLSNVKAGRIVLVLSTKLRDAQNRPERALVRVNQRDSALGHEVSVCIQKLSEVRIHFSRWSLQPCPQLDSCAAFCSASPWPFAPVLRVPSSKREPQVELFSMSVQ